MGELEFNQIDLNKLSANCKISVELGNSCLDKINFEY
jgi:hypothetical protein